MASDETMNDWQRRCYALVDEKYALEQQLAQAQEENRTMYVLLTECFNVLGESYKTAEQRALFERLRVWHMHKWNAALAKEPSDGK